MELESPTQPSTSNQQQSVSENSRIRGNSTCQLQRLLIKENHISVYETEEIIRTKYQKKTKILVDNEPEFCLEPSGLDGSVFILKRNNRSQNKNFTALGLINYDEGTIDSSDVYKKYHLNKLNLRPNLKRELYQEFDIEQSQYPLLRDDVIKYEDNEELSPKVEDIKLGYESPKLEVD